MNNLFVFDTDSLVSASLIGRTMTARSMDKAVISGKLTFSDATITELVEVLFRKKFDKYSLNDEEKGSAIEHISLNAVFFSLAETTTACRDPKDNKFSGLVVAVNASCFITGDKDLLILHPFRNIPILSTVDFLNNF